MLLIYAADPGLNALINRVEFRRSSEKAIRYRALPLRDKLACRCGVIPLFVAFLFSHPAFFVAGFMVFVRLERLCVRGYRKKRLPSVSAPWFKFSSEPPCRGIGRAPALR